MLEKDSKINIEYGKLGNIKFHFIPSESTKLLFCIHKDKQGDIYWCIADIGWITGHSYIIYGPLLSAATSIMFEGIPSYPDSGRFWQIMA